MTGVEASVDDGMLERTLVDDTFGKFQLGKHETEDIDLPKKTQATIHN